MVNSSVTEPIRGAPERLDFNAAHDRGLSCAGIIHLRADLLNDCNLRGNHFKGD